MLQLLFVPPGLVELRTGTEAGVTTEGRRRHRGLSLKIDITKHALNPGF